jgi:hypothetical protein
MLIKYERQTKKIHMCNRTNLLYINKEEVIFINHMQTQINSLIKII